MIIPAKTNKSFTSKFAVDFLMARMTCVFMDQHDLWNNVLVFFAHRFVFFDQKDFTMHIWNHCSIEFSIGFGKMRVNFYDFSKKESSADLEVLKAVIEWFPELW